MKGKNIAGKIKKIRLFVFDVDGVFTPGTMPYTEKGDETKVFHTYDGMGLELLRIAGYLQNRPYILAAISGEDRESTARRFTKLKFNEIHVGVNDKLSVLDEIMRRYNVKGSEEIAFFGDDVNDIPLLEHAGFRVITANTPAKAKEYMKKKGLVDYETKLKGGEGAVREAIDLMLEGIGLWEKAVEVRTTPEKNMQFKRWQAENYKTNTKHHKSEGC